MKKYLLLLMSICMLTVFVSGCGSQRADNGSSSGSVQNRIGSSDSVSATEICDVCNGAGKTQCTWCKGTGVMSAAGTTYTCSCGGSGYVTCYSCNGTGEKITVQADSDYAGGYTGDNPGISGGSSITIPDTNNTSNCPSCGGLGWSVCSSCRGTGEIERTHSAPNYGYGSSTYSTGQRCARCSGTGKAPCIRCGGDGQI